MVIVHVLTRLLRAGSEENTLETCRAQVAAGHRVVLVHGREFDMSVHARAAQMLQVIKIDRLVHRISPANDLAAVFEMYNLFRLLGAGVVHTHQSKAGILGRFAAKIANVPKIIHGVHILPFVNAGRFEGAVYVAAERVCAAFTDAFISVSPSVRDACIDRGIGVPERHFVAFSAMDVERFKSPSPPADWRALLNIGEGQDRPPTVVMLAAFEPRKQHADFIRALPKAFLGLSDWRVLFAGEGELEFEAKQLAKELGISDKVRFAGYRTDPEAIIALADVCVLTSIREGLPRVLVQYAAAGKPTVVSNLPGITDVVTDGVNAVITPAGKADAAACEVARLLGDPKERDRLTRGVRQIDVEAWSSESMNRSITAAYDQVIKD